MNIYINTQYDEMYSKFIIAYQSLYIYIYILFVKIKIVAKRQPKMKYMKIFAVRYLGVSKRWKIH